MTAASPDPTPLTDAEFARLEEMLSPANYGRLTAARVRATITTLKASLDEAEKRADHNDRGWNTALEVAAKWSAKATDANGTADALVSVVQGWRERAERAEAANAASSRREEMLREALEELDAVIDFSEPGSEDKAVIFADWTDYNLALEKARAALSTTPATRTLGRTPGTHEVCDGCKEVWTGECIPVKEGIIPARKCPITRPAAAGEGT